MTGRDLGPLDETAWMRDIRFQMWERIIVFGLRHWRPGDTHLWADVLHHALDVSDALFKLRMALYEVERVQRREDMESNARP